MSISTWTTVCQNFKSKFVKLMGAWPIWRWDIILAGPARTSWRMRTGGMPHGELHNPEGLFFSWFTTRRWMLFRKFSSTIGQEAVFWRCACKGTSRALWAVAVTPLQQYYFVRTYCWVEDTQVLRTSRYSCAQKRIVKYFSWMEGFLEMYPSYPLQTRLFHVDEV